jgi:anti-sigma factor RsiW
MSTPKNCSAIENELALFVGGELGPRSRAEVEEHLQRCAACVEAVGGLTRARAALRAGLGEGASRVPDLWPGVRTRLVESGTIHAPLAPASRAPASAAPRSMPRWIPLSAAAAALFALGLWLAQRNNPGPQMQTRGSELVARAPSRGLEVQPVGLRRLEPGESALSSSAVTIEELQDEARLRAASQPGGAQAASQYRGIH